MTKVGQKQVERLKASLKNEATITRLVETYKVLGDLTRLKLCMLLTEAELCVGDLADLLGISESAISHQLRLLRSLRLVKCRREGQRAFYALDDEHVGSLIKQGLNHVAERDSD